MACPSSNLGSASQVGFSLWATSNQALKKKDIGLGVWRWMIALYECGINVGS
jgi:hypothetical protein